MARRTGGRLRALLFLSLSLAAAVTASVVVYEVIDSYRRTLGGLGDEVEVVAVMMASHDLWQGETIGDDDLELVEFLPAYVPDGVLRSTEQAVGRVPRERILAHEFIRDERLADSSAGVGLNAIIPRGMRAISLDMSDGASVSGFLQPGNYVDALLTITGDEGGEAETVTLLQAVTVLAVNGRLGAEANGTPGKGKPTVTVAITPDLAEKLTHALAQGSVTFTLRSDIDVTHVETHGAKVTELLGGAGEGQRITIQEWNERTAEGSTDEILIISGPDVRREQVQTP